MNPIQPFMLSYCRSKISLSPNIRYMVQGMITATSAQAAAEWGPWESSQLPSVRPSSMLGTTWGTPPSGV